MYRNYLECEHCPGCGARLEKEIRLWIAGAPAHRTAADRGWEAVADAGTLRLPTPARATTAQCVACGADRSAFLTDVPKY